MPGLKLTRLFPDWMIVPFRNMVEGEYETEMSLIEKRLAEVSGFVLDMGVGSGELGLPITCKNYVGIDNNEYLLTLAAKKGRGMFAGADLTALPFSNDIFSAVIMSKVGHHLDDDSLEMVSAEIFRVLSPGGRLIFLDPVPPSKKTTLLHRFVAMIELGSYHRKFDESALFFRNFKLDSVEYFRKRHFDFYVAGFVKS